MAVSTFRAVFVSDLHLGFHLAREQAFAEWLERLQTDQLYLNGDILDGWRLQRRFNWNRWRSRILERLLELRREGVVIRVLPGNHDDFLRGALPRGFDLELSDHFVHEALDGRRFWVTHGDLYDPVERKRRWLSTLGSRLFDGLSRCLPASAMHRLKRSSKQVFGRPLRLQAELVRRARQQGLDGVIFGHIHRPLLQQQPDGWLVGNSGDWVEHASFLAESAEGSWSLFDQGRCLATFPGSPMARRGLPVEAAQPSV